MGEEEGDQSEKRNLLWVCKRAGEEESTGARHQAAFPTLYDAPIRGREADKAHGHERIRPDCKFCNSNLYE